MNKQAERIDWIDYAKVICIILMVTCHAGQKGIILDITYQFHMPAFFIISGLLFHPKGIKKDIKNFGIPIILLGGGVLIYRIVHILYNSYQDINELFYNSLSLIVESIKSLFWTSSISWFQGYWFVATLLLMRIIMNIRILRGHIIILLFVCILYCCIESCIPIPVWVYSFIPYHIISCLPFFIIGLFLKKNNIDVMRGHFEIKFLVLILFLVLTNFQGYISLGGYKYGLNYLLVLVNAIFGSFLLFNLCRLLPHRKYIKVLSTGTFLILGVHGIMYGYINKIQSLFAIHNTYSPLLTGCIVCLLLYPVILWLDKHFPILLGKEKRMKCL